MLSSTRGGAEEASPAPSSAAEDMMIDLLFLVVVVVICAMETALVKTSNDCALQQWCLQKPDDPGRGSNGALDTCQVAWTHQWS